MDRDQMTSPGALPSVSPASDPSRPYNTQPIHSSYDTEGANAPEVAPSDHFSSAPEVAPHQPHEYYGKVSVQPGEVPVFAISHDGQPESPYQKDAEGIIPAEGEERPPWWKRKKILWSVIALVLLIVIALGVGLGVGLTSGSNDDSSDSSSGDSSSSDDSNNDDADNGGSDNGGSDSEADAERTFSCDDYDGGICPQVFATAEFQDRLFIFARGAENTIRYRSGDDGDLSTWDEEWTELGHPDENGELASQPAAVSWSIDGEDARLDMMVVNSNGNTVYGRHIVGDVDSDWSAWEELGSGLSSPVYTCKIGDRIDMWATSEKNSDVIHDWWWPGDGWAKGVSGWQYQNIAQASTSPAVVCREEITHDVVWYERSRSRVWHSHWDDDWSSSPKSYNGDFAGDPTLFSFSDNAEHFVFFGIQEDNELYHWSWSGSSEEYSEMESLGGNLTSVPSVISLSRGTYDVVATGTNGKLQRLHYDGSNWAGDWEELDFDAYSAPMVVSFGGEVIIFALGEEGTVMAASLDVNADSQEWADEVEVEEFGEDFSTEFFVRD